MIMQTVTGPRAPSRPGRCGSASAGPSAAERPPWSQRSAWACATSWRSAVVTNDIYTTEDADFLRRAGVLADDRIRAVRTGCCPHTAIRDDIAANLEAAEDLEHAHAPLDLLIIESGGDNLTATFSRGLVDAQIFVLDVSGGDKVPRKGGPGVSLSDLLVINKTDLAGYVGADLSVMRRDAGAGPRRPGGDLQLAARAAWRAGGPRLGPGRGPRPVSGPRQ